MEKFTNLLWDMLVWVLACFFGVMLVFLHQTPKIDRPLLKNALILVCTVGVTFFISRAIWRYFNLDMEVAIGISTIVSIGVNRFFQNPEGFIDLVVSIYQKIRR